ncbi:hypothetical protein [Thalassospira sp.]|uniref:hypothetical protein n=1 Tax=Thalassospira sp. TaxID=1912094 RepID=UPI000C4A61BF|nr:hypothetical protein [Thalassospira sp.]MAL40612.1 hypothetical protein [Thalassospira sp.]|tara:strand:- start:57 stop:1109 length:1053 start_codon:yes stop_codon:yes gene_type:complete
MFERKTVFVIGAGASKEFNLPVGLELRDIISDKLNILYSDGVSFSNGDRAIDIALRRHSDNNRSDNYSQLIDAAWAVRDGVKQAVSIDSYLDSHRDNQKIVLCGKLAILSSIIEAERNSTLFVGADSKPEYPYKTLSPFDEVRGTWLDFLFQKLSDGISRDNVANIFENVSFITFNYDRTIEHYLFLSLQNYFRLDANEAVEAMKRLKIVHPYGLIAPLQWMDQSEGLPYGSYGQKNLLDIVPNIQTYTESLRDPALLDMAHNDLGQAENVVFLGFAFHKQNMELLNTRMENRPIRVFSSSFGVSSADCKQIQLDLIKQFKRPPEHVPFFMGNQLKCSEVFLEFGRGMMS